MELIELRIKIKQIIVNFFVYILLYLEMYITNLRQIGMNEIRNGEDFRQSLVNTENISSKK